METIDVGGKTVAVAFLKRDADAAEKQALELAAQVEALSDRLSDLEALLIRLRRDIGLVPS